MSNQKTYINISIDESSVADLEKLLHSDEIDIIRFGKSYALFDQSLEQDEREYMEAAKVLSSPKNNEDGKIQMEFVPYAENVDFIEKGKVVVRVIDKHNFYEAEAMPEDYLNEAPIGLLTKLWIYISRATQES